LFDEGIAANLHRPVDMSEFDEEETNRKGPDVSQVTADTPGIQKSVDKHETSVEVQEAPVTSAVAETAKQKSPTTVKQQDIAVVKADTSESAIVSVADEVPSPKTVKPMKAIEMDPDLSKPEQPVAERAPAVKSETPRQVVAAAEAAKDSADQPEPGSQEVSVAAQSKNDSPVETAAETPPVKTVDDLKTAAKNRLAEKKKCYGCDLAGLDLSGMDLRNVDLEKADLTGCSFSGADLRNGNFKGAIILNAVFRDADLRGADFYKADLSGTDITGAKIEKADFEDSQLYGVIGLKQE
jgi:hypothetical protein